MSPSGRSRGTKRLSNPVPAIAERILDSVSVPSRTRSKMPRFTSECQHE